MIEFIFVFVLLVKIVVVLVMCMIDGFCMMLFGNEGDMVFFL